MSDPRNSVGVMNLPKLLSGRRHRPQRPDHRGPNCGDSVHPERERDGEHADYMGWVAATVGEYGWAISGRHGDRHTPPWAYSVGLWLSAQVPELVICGLPVENGAAIINAIGARLAEGAEFTPDDMLVDACPAALTFRPVDVSWRKGGLFPTSDDFYGMVRPPYLQVVWSDREGRFPGEAGFSEAFEPMQPLLWLPRADNPPSPWTRLDHPA
jgi:Domain of unknown function (DUF4262)